MGKSVEARIRELEEKLSDLLARWPAHSVPPEMWQEREELEEVLERLRGEDGEEVPEEEN